MIQLRGGAGRLVVDATRVELEGLLGGVDGDGGWANLPDGGQERGFGTRRNVVEAGDRGALVGSVVLAGVRSSRGVWVRGFGVDSTVGDNVLEGLIHEATIASFVSLGGRAVHQILLRERDERTLLDEPGSLHRSSGRERPARSALALVLDWGHGTLSSPVDGLRRIGVDLLDGEAGGESRGGVWDARDVDSIVAGTELQVGHVGEFVVSNGESTVLREVLDILVVGSEDFESPVVFLLGGINLGKGNLVVAPVSLDTDVLLIEGSKSNSSEKC